MNEHSRSPHRPSFPIHHFQIDPLEVLLLSWLIMAECISTIDRLWPPSASLSSLDLGLEVHSKLARSLPPIAPPSSLDLALQVQLQTRSIIAPKEISKSTWSRCGGMVELTSHPKGVREKQRFWLEEGMKRGWEDRKGYPALSNHTNCMDLWMLGKREGDQVLGETACVYFV